MAALQMKRTAFGARFSWFARLRGGLRGWVSSEERCARIRIIVLRRLHMSGRRVRVRLRGLGSQGAGRRSPRKPPCRRPPQAAGTWAWRSPTVLGECPLRNRGLRLSSYPTPHTSKLAPQTYVQPFLTGTPSATVASAASLNSTVGGSGITRVRTSLESMATLIAMPSDLHPFGRQRRRRVGEQPLLEGLVLPAFGDDPLQRGTRDAARVLPAAMARRVGRRGGWRD